MLTAYYGNIEMVRSLLHYGAAVDQTNRSGHTALFYAVRTGRKDIVRILIEHNADVTHKSGGGEFHSTS
jgi:ankyrin repeat protein